MRRLNDAPYEQEWLAQAKTRLEGLREVGEIAGFVAWGREQVIEQAAAYPGRVRTRMLSDLIDTVIRRMLEVACEGSPGGQDLQAQARRSLAVVATGGYGRRELAPFSDVDINFIAASEDDAEVDEITRRMFRLIMDVFLAEAKLKVGYAYRLLNEAGALHHQNQTALLDARYVAGSRDLYQSFQDELRRQILPVAFMHDKLKERNSLSSRRGGSMYLVEPDIKEGEGSLRDIHTASWLAQVAFGFASKTVWEDVRNHGVLTSAEVDAVEDVMEFYSRVRWEMHLEAGKQADHLTVPKQEAIAPRLGYQDGQDGPAPLLMMRDYYRHAEIARRLVLKMTAQARSRRLQLEPGIAAEGGRVVLQNPEAFQLDPVAVLRVFAYCQRYGLKLSQEAVDALRECVRSCEAPVESPEAARLFLMILRGEAVAETLMEMSRTGMLQWYIPEFGDVMRTVPFDAAHEYTVGWHSLLVVSRCESLARSMDEENLKIMANVRRPELLYLLALTHDIGKADREGDHTQTGAVMGSRVAERLNLDEASVQHLDFLIRNHQLMSDTARLRDLNLRRTVEDFVAVVNDVELLSMLFIFTNADVASVGSSSWSELQGRFLRELYYRAERAIVNQTPLIDSEEDLALYRRRVSRELSLTNLPPEAVEQHVASMPAIYLLNTGPEEMASHIEFIQKAEAGEASTDFRSESGSDFTELTVCVKDDPAPGLLSKIAGALWALDINVHAAQVFTREQPVAIALDTLYADFEGKQLPEFKKHQVHRDLTRVLQGEMDVADLLAQKRKQLPEYYESSSLEVLNDLSEQHTVVDIHAPDQPGLLYRMTRAFASLGWDIHSARVSTWGQEARDSFYVTAAGAKIEEPDAQQMLENALRSVS